MARNFIVDIIACSCCIAIVKFHDISDSLWVFVLFFLCNATGRKKTLPFWGKTLNQLANAKMTPMLDTELTVN